MKRPLLLSSSLFASLMFASSLAHADPDRMEQIVKQIGIESEDDSAEAKAAEAAVERLVSQAQSAYPTLKVKDEELAARRYNVDAARAAYQPLVSLSGSTARQEVKDFDLHTRSRYANKDLTATLRENIWRGGRDAGEIAISKQNEALAEIDQNAERTTIDFSTRKAALEYNFRSMRQLIEEAAATDASEIRSLADRKFQARQAGRIDVLNATMRESSAKASVARNSLNTQQALLNLTSLLGPSQSPDVMSSEIKTLAVRSLPYPRLSPLLNETVPPSFSEKIAIATEKRSDLALSQGYRQRFYPDIDFLGRYTRAQNQSNYNQPGVGVIKGNTASSSFELQLNWTLWDSSLDARNNTAAAEKNVASAQLANTRYQLQSETSRLRNFIQEAHKNLDISLNAYKTAGELYAAQKKLYETGLIGIQPLIDAQLEKRSALSEWHQNVYDLQRNLLQWQALQKGLVQAG